ncbi:MAG: FKBP-type peptidyl-prolyl cis-trans isomerase [Ferruginibacter sp.]
MNKLSWLLFSVILLTSCKKTKSNCEYSESNASASPTERTYIENYLASNNFAAFQHTSGFYYNITNAGTSAKPSICSVIRVKYSGYLFNGTLFDSYTSSSGISFVLGQLIVGWQKGLPLIGSAGTIILYIPPSLGYGQIDRRDANGAIVIPANSYLKFVIELMDVQ